MDRLWLFIDPPKMSPLEAPGSALNRFREIASRLKIAARERELIVGVEGMELFPVRNLNKPY